MAVFGSAYTVSSSFGYTGHSASSGAGLRDGVETGATSVWGSANTASNWIKADLGALVTVDAVQLRCIPVSFDGWGIIYTNDAIIQTSTDDSTWTDRTTITGVVEGSQSNFNLNVQARYVRVFRTSGNWLALGDFKIDYTEISSPRDRMFMLF